MNTCSLPFCFFLLFYCLLYFIVFMCVCFFAFFATTSWWIKIYTVSHKNVHFLFFRKIKRWTFFETQCRIPCGDQKTSASVKDWCMLPHGIAGPLYQSSWNSGNKCPLARALKVPYFVTPNRSLRYIRCRKLVLPEKWTKVHLKTCYAPMTVIVPNFIALGGSPSGYRDCLPDSSLLGDTESG